MADVLPDGNRWTSRIQVGTVADAVEVRTGEPYPQVDSCSWTARVACSRCNSGWMSRLEGEVRLVLAPFLVGAGGAVEPQSASVLARWCVKTALVLASAASKPWTPDAVMTSALKSGALPLGQAVVSAATVPTGLDGWAQIVNVAHGGFGPSGALFVDAVRGGFAFSVALAPDRVALPGWFVLAPHGWLPLLNMHEARSLPRARLADAMGLGIARAKLLDMTGTGKLASL